MSRVLLIPKGWTRGELLNVQRYSDGTFKISRLHVEKDEPLVLTNPFDAQQFVSWWYAPIEARRREYDSPRSMDPR